MVVTLFLTVLGGFIGSVMLQAPGMVIGLAVGYLGATLWHLQDRVASLETKLADRRARGPVTSPVVAPKASLSPPTAADTPQHEQRAPAEPVGVASPLEKSTPTSASAATPPPPRPKPMPPLTDPEWLFDAIRTWFTSGNVVARVGVIVLFFGVAFLLKFVVDRGVLPIELRLVGVAVGGMVLFGVGWRIRHDRRPYGLIIQGAGIGVLYLTVFAASKLYGFFPPALAFFVMVALVGATGALAVLQDAKGLAVFGMIGGFLAPVLMSTASGNHVLLFSYYGVLNVGVLGIAWFKAWRELNLVGFVFTFVIATLWGVQSYQPRHFATTEPFLIGFFVLYVAVAVLFAHHQPPHLYGYVDGTLVFGVPVVAFALQHALVRDIEYGLALSALGASAVYIALATALWKRRREGMRMLAEAFLALGVVSGSLAIPLALDGRWTAAAWALEGAAFVWVGVRQQRWLVRGFGVLLQLGAGVFFLRAIGDPTGELPVLNGWYLGCVIIGVAGLFSSFFLERHRDRLTDEERIVAVPLLVWGLLWWVVGGAVEINRHVERQDWVSAGLVFLAASSGVMGWLSAKLSWTSMRYPPIGLLPAMILLGLASVGTHPFARWGSAAWAIGLSTQYHLMWRFDRDWPRELIPVWHAATWWGVVALAVWEAAWSVGRIEGLASSWEFAAWGLVPSLMIAALVVWGDRLRWPVQVHWSDYLGLGVGPVAVAMVCWSAVSWVQSGKADPLPYLPLLNPLDITQLTALSVLMLWEHQTRRHTLSVFADVPRERLMMTVGAVVFLWFNAVLARTVHAWADVPFSVDDLFRSNVFQATISIAWSIVALGLMVGANLKQHRPVWRVGGVLLGLVVAKLFLIDLAGTGTIARIISFVAVGLLMLLIGYWSPLPPRRREGAA
ncbi:MAG: DUF2339 domain-containing protein [Nitrospirota bacterium]